MVWWHQVWEKQNTVVATCQKCPSVTIKARQCHTRPLAHLESILFCDVCVFYAREVLDLGKLEWEIFNLIRKNYSQLRGPLLQLWVTWKVHKRSVNLLIDFYDFSSQVTECSLAPNRIYPLKLDQSKKPLTGQWSPGDFCFTYGE